jgi:hypothetical protein
MTMISKLVLRGKVAYFDDRYGVNTCCLSLFHVYRGYDPMNFISLLHTCSLL